MDRYTKGFVLASLIYFLAASLLGIHMGASGASEGIRFAHVHLNLLGFMSMMIYGVGYFILPRFNGRELRWPSWIRIHFYAANVGLAGMVAAAPGRPSGAFTAFAALSALSVAMFVANLAATMLLAPEAEEEEEREAAPSATAGGGAHPAPGGRHATGGCDCGDGTDGPYPDPVTGSATLHPDMRVGEIITRWPQTVEAFVAGGFGSLGNPGHREKVRHIPVTLRMACQRHNLDLDAMLARLAATIPEAERPVPAGPGGGTTAAGAARKGSLTRGEPIRPEHILGDILAVYPGTEKVFRKYYGGGCFSCPGQATESVKQSALLHNVDAKTILAELNRAAGL